MPVTTRMSAKGQIVLPQEIRKKMGLVEGDTFVVFASEGEILIRKVEIPSDMELFERLMKWGAEVAKEKGVTDDDVIKLMHDIRLGKR